MKRGYTFVEVVVALAVMSALAGVAAPAAAVLADRLAVELQAARFLSAYRSAWLSARRGERIALLRITADTLAIRTVPSAGASDTTLEWVATGPAAAGVLLTSPSHTAVFGPDGVAMGLANARHVLRKGGAKREVVVSRLGRVRIGN